MGAGICELKPGYTVESAQAPLQGLFTQIRQYEITLPRRQEVVAVPRDQFMKGQLVVESGGDGLLAVCETIFRPR